MKKKSFFSPFLCFEGCLEGQRETEGRQEQKKTQKERGADKDTETREHQQQHFLSPFFLFAHMIWLRMENDFSRDETYRGQLIFKQ